MESLLLDLRFALRALRKSPGFTFVCVLTLALGIGANTAIFSALDAALFRPLAYAGAERLAIVHLTERPAGDPGAKPVNRFRWSWPKFQTLATSSTTPFDRVAAFGGGTATRTGIDTPEPVSIEMVSASYFETLAVAPAQGRTFAPSEANVAVVSEGFWTHRLGGAELSGLRLGLNGKSLAVVGVLPAGFEGLSGRKPDVFVPVTDMIPREAAANRWMHFLNVVARLKPGLSPEGAAAGTALAGQVVAVAHPSPFTGEEWSATLDPLESARVEPALRRSLFVLAGAAGFVLLIGCINLASLLLARAETRRREMAIRVALGAGRGRLMRYSLAESALLALSGGVAGLFLARWSFEAIARLAPPASSAFPGMSYLVDLSGTSLEPRAVLFALALSCATALALGLLPGIRAWRGGLPGALAEGPPRGPGSRPGRMGAVVVVAQLAIALVLLNGAGLLAKSLWRLLHVDLGFKPESLVTLRVDTPLPARGDSTLFRSQLVTRLAAVAGVSSVAAATCAPLAGKCNDGLAWSPEDATARAEAPRIDVSYVEAATFGTFGIPVRGGRVFDTGDRETTAKVVVVNEALARIFWPGMSPLGKRLEISTQTFRKGEAALVVGVVGDVRYGRLEEPALPHAYLPDAQGGSGIPVSHVTLRSTLGQTELVAALRRAVRNLDPNLAIYDVRAMPARIVDASARPRFATALLSSFAALAVLIASLGVLGVMAYAVSTRAREIGVRMALGAPPAEIFALFLRRGLVLSGAGLAVGTCGAVVLTRVLGTLLFGVTPIDLPVFAAAAGLLGCLAALGSVLPARLALRVDPVSILRTE